MKKLIDFILTGVVCGVHLFFVYAIIGLGILIYCHKENLLDIPLEYLGWFLFCGLGPVSFALSANKYNWVE